MSGMKRFLTDDFVSSEPYCDDESHQVIDETDSYPCVKCDARIEAEEREFQREMLRREIRKEIRAVLDEYEEHA